MWPRFDATGTGNHMTGTGSDVTGTGSYLNRKSRVLGGETADQYEKLIVSSGPLRNAGSKSKVQFLERG